MSHIVLTYHIIFCTYKRMSVIDLAHEKELYKFILDFSTKRNVLIRRIGGMPEHIHILCDLPQDLSIMKYVKLLKTETSKFMRVNNHFPLWQSWARGYGAFTVDASLRETRRLYIMNQKEHHRKVSFLDEYKAFLIENGLSLDTPLLGDEESPST